MYPDRWQQIPSRCRRWAALAVAVAVLLAPGLHAHADSGGGHQDCYVCGQLARDTAPPPASVSLPAPSPIRVGRGETRDQQSRSFLPIVSRARGPPVFIA